VLERIASGGMGEVFRAHDAVLAREVAIKVLHRSLAGDPAFVERFRREARAAAGLTHPNIVAVYDWGAVDGIYYMVMEYVRGPSVRHLLNERGRLEPAHAVEILRQTLLALGHAHHEGLVHRDMKPENLLVTREGVVKVADFGLARAYADGRVTQAGAVTGTVQYLAPEQIRGEPADPRSDLYSLGIVAYELLTGKLPFTGETAMAVAYKHLSDRVPAPTASVPGLVPELDGFVASATDRDRELRPESADTMRMDLDGIASQVPQASKLAILVQELPEITVEGGETTEVRLPLETASIPRMERRRQRRRRIRRFAGAIAVLALVAAAAWGTWIYAIPHTAVIPELVGDPVAIATDRLTELGFQVEVGQAQYDDSIPEGSVIRVRPKVGAELEVDAIVTIIPSLGPPPVAVPPIEGRLLKDARRLLERAGFEVDRVKQRFDEKVPAGHVISRQPSDAQLPTGSRLTLVVSKGPRPVPVPDVRGKTEANAERVLDEKGFVVVIERIFSTTVDRGNVVRTDPANGTSLQPGETVVMNVSLGPKHFACPNFVGMHIDEAEALAESWGLRLNPVLVPGGSGDRIVSQDPLAGTRVSYGETVDAYYV
jgi:eukaryotic-like serine/threonine-protein kinase